MTIFFFLLEQSLDDSVALSPSSTTSAGSDHAHKEAESLRSQLAEREQEVSRMREEAGRAERESEELRSEVAALKDKLNVSEVHTPAGGFQTVRTSSCLVLKLISFSK